MSYADGSATRTVTTHREHIQRTALQLEPLVDLLAARWLRATERNPTGAPALGAAESYGWLWDEAQRVLSDLGAPRLTLEEFRTDVRTGFLAVLATPPF